MILIDPEGNLVKGGSEARLEEELKKAEEPVRVDLVPLAPAREVVGVRLVGRARRLGSLRAQLGRVLAEQRGVALLVLGVPQEVLLQVLVDHAPRGDLEVVPAVLLGLAEALERAQLALRIGPDGASARERQHHGPILTAGSSGRGRLDPERGLVHTSNVALAALNYRLIP